jgi:hypothetical protein
MAFSFPAAPTTGQTYQGPNGVTYTWDGTKWTGNIGSVNYVAKSGDTMSGALTVQNDLTVTGDIMERGRFVASNFDTLTLNVATTGSANPADPIGNAAGSGDAFDTFSNAINYVANRINVLNLTINIASGTYNESGCALRTSVRLNPTGAVNWNLTGTAAFTELWLKGNLNITSTTNKEVFYVTLLDIPTGVVLKILGGSISPNNTCVTTSSLNINGTLDVNVTNPPNWNIIRVGLNGGYANGTGTIKVTSPNSNTTVFAVSFNGLVYGSFTIDTPGAL